MKPINKNTKNLKRKTAQTTNKIDATQLGNLRGRIPLKPLTE